MMDRTKKYLRVYFLQLAKNSQKRKKKFVLQCIKYMVDILIISSPTNGI